MRIHFHILVPAALTAILLCTTGCRTARDRADDYQSAVAAAKGKLATNQTQQVDAATKYVHATGLALNQETNPSAPVILAKDLNQSAQVILGPPDMKDALFLKQMVDGLLSTNQQLHAHAERQKAALDAQVVALQKQVDTLQQQLTAKEKERDKDYIAAADKATLYDKWMGRLRTVLIIIAALFILSITLPILSTLFPMIAPVANIVVGGIGSLVGSVFKLMPKAMASAGVVAKQAHDLSENTLRDLVVAIQDVKKTKPQIFDAHLRPVLVDITDKNTTRKKIASIKERMHSLTPEDVLT